jgi:flagellar M-ring protein FliF
VAPLPEPPLWEQPWLWDVAKQISGVLVALILALVVLRPVMRSLAKVPPTRVALPRGQGEGQLADDQVTLGNDEVPRLPSGANYENNLNAARGMVGQDSRLVAQVVKGWVANEV